MSEKGTPTKYRQWDIAFGHAETKIDTCFFVSENLGSYQDIRRSALEI